MNSFFRKISEINIEKKLIFYIISILLLAQMLLFVIFAESTKKTEQNNLKQLLLQQTMVVLQRLQTNSSQQQATVIKKIHIPNAEITITPFAEWPMRITDKNLWKAYTKLKLQTEHIQLSYYLLNGKWLNFDIILSPTKLALEYFILLTEIIITIILLVFFIFIYRYIKSLKSIAQTANKLGLNLNSSPLKAKGSSVVSNTFNAINEMQNKIQNLINERTSMLAAISHDLRTPLTRLRLRSDFVNDPMQQQKLNADLDEMEQMISQIMAFAKNDHELQQQTHIDLSALLISLTHDFVDSGAQVKYFGVSTPIYVWGSSLALKRAFSNVIENAIKYAGFATVNLFVDNTINIVISDDGPGIPAEHVPRIFEPFYRAESSRSRKTGGSGLGLAITKNIIVAHQGEIAFSKNDASGLEVKIEIPNKFGNITNISDH
jgi:signal transduction histidine kinase